MFLTGIFSARRGKVLSTETLEVTASELYDVQLSKVVKDSLYDIVIREFDENGHYFKSNYIESLAWGMERNRRLGIYSEKKRHKEVAIDSFSEDGTLAPFTVADETLSNELSLVEQPTISWQTLINRDTIEAFDFRLSLEEYIDSYNLVCSYYESNYGFDFKELLLNALKGIEDARVYLLGVLERENDAEFAEAFFELIRYEEFYDFLSSDRKVLTIEEGLV